MALTTSCSLEHKIETRDFDEIEFKSNNNLTIYLKSDGTFKVIQEISDERQLRCSGFWEYKETIGLVFISDNLSRLTPIGIESKNKAAQEILKICVKRKDSIELAFAEIQLDEEFYKTNKSGCVEIYDSKAKRITVYYLGEQYQYEFKNPDTSELVLYIELKDYTACVYDEQIWLLKYSSIYNSKEEKFKATGKRSVMTQK